MVRPLYLHWPTSAEAYRRPSQYTLGRDVLVAPVTEPGDPAEVEVWLPPGTWIEWFTGKRHRGPATKTMSVPLSRIPVFVRAGAIVPAQPERATTPVGPPRSLVLQAYRGDGRTKFYDDSGKGFAYERGRFARTKVTQRRKSGRTKLTIGRDRGRFAAQPRRRGYEVRLIGVGRPEKVRVGGRKTDRWSYDPETSTVSVRTGRRPTDRKTKVVISSKR